QSTVETVKPLSPEQLKEAQDAVRRKIAESQAETESNRSAPSPAQGAEANTTKLIFPFSTNEVSKPTDVEEALQRKLEQLSDEEWVTRPHPAPAGRTNAPSASTNQVFNVQEYHVAGSPALPTNTLPLLFSKRTGTNIGLDEIVKAAQDLQAEFRNQGF